MHAVRDNIYRMLRCRSRDEVTPHLEKTIFGLGLANPLTAIPQLYQIWGAHAVGGLSLVTVAAALTMSVLWTAYGVLTRQTALWATNALWVVMNGAIAVGVAVFS